MADALCGPSNPLQHFQKQTSADRSLQQDRLQGRPGASQGFRSSAGPNAGALDAEFEAFHRGSPLVPPPPELQHQFLSGPSNYAHETQSQSPEPAGWAADFQSLHLGDAPSLNLQAQAGRSSYASDWRQYHDGAYHQLQGPPSVRGGEQSNYRQQGYMGVGSRGMNMPSMFGGVGAGSLGSASQTGTLASQEQEETFDAAAFERAFDSARTELQEREASIVQHEEGLELGQDVMINESEARYMGEELDDAGERLGADAIPDSQKRESAGTKDDQDELARTAGHLLDSVQDNQSQKFQDSTFLALMRRFRDKEAFVEGDSIVEDRPDTVPENPGRESSGARLPTNESSTVEVNELQYA